MQLLLQYYQGWMLRLVYDFLLRNPSIDLRINILGVQLCGKHRCCDKISQYVHIVAIHLRELYNALSFVGSIPLVGLTNFHVTCRSNCGLISESIDSFLFRLL
jgi:hypothetical protein